MAIYEHSVKAMDGSMVSLKDYEGKVLLIVNTATGCGFTPQYTDLQALYEADHDKGLEILDFPCDQFAHQTPGTDEEVHNFCTGRFGITFPQFSKLEVNGENAEPLFAELATALPFEGFGRGLKAMAMSKVAKAIDKEHGDKAYIKWNFTKFLVDREGNVVARFEPTVDMGEVKQAVAAAL